MPRRFLDHPGPIPFAHRGGAGDWPENTMPAFENAVGLGYRYVETDVHVTSDGVVVAFHDDQLDRVTDARGAIASLPWSVVRSARVAPPPGASSGCPTDACIPSLEELLGAWPDLRVNIDPKADAVVAALVGVIERTGAQDRVCLGAFSDRRLARLRGLLGAQVCTSAGPLEVARLRLASGGVPTWGFAADCIQVPLRAAGRRLVDRRLVDAAHGRGLAVHVWTIDDPETMERLLDLGVDGIMTDRPAALKAVLQRRGEWRGAGGQT